MSIRIMTAVWDTPLPDSEKIVLLALADCANDEGLCWPSMATLAAKCSKSDRTVQAAIKSLREAGHLSREENPGKGCRYIVHPRSGFTPEAIAGGRDFTPEAASPPKGTAPTPEAASDKPSGTITPPVSAIALPTPAGGSGPANKTSGKRKKASASVKAARPVGSRIDPSWQAPPITDLPLPVQAIVRQWPSGAYELTALQFLNHWLAEGRGIAAKRDWPKTWENWLMRESAAILRALKAGQRFDAPAAAVPSPAEDAATQAVLALKAGESTGMKPFRASIRSAIGLASYDGWVKATAFCWRDGALICTAPSKFKADYVLQHFEQAIVAAAKASGAREVVLRCEVVKPPGLPAKREPVAA